MTYETKQEPLRPTTSQRDSQEAQAQEGVWRPTQEDMNAIADRVANGQRKSQEAQALQVESDPVAVLEAHTAQLEANGHIGSPFAVKSSQAKLDALNAQADSAIANALERIAAAKETIATIGANDHYLGDVDPALLSYQLAASQLRWSDMRATHEFIGEWEKMLTMPTADPSALAQLTVMRDFGEKALRDIYARQDTSPYDHSAIHQEQAKKDVATLKATTRATLIGGDALEAFTRATDSLEPLEDALHKARLAKVALETLQIDKNGRVVSKPAPRWMPQI